VSRLFTALATDEGAIQGDRRVEAFTHRPAKAKPVIGQQTAQAIETKQWWNQLLGCAI
jgi:hypothetical protein